MNYGARMDDPFKGFRAPIKEEVILCPRNLRVVGEISSYAQSAIVIIAMPLHNQASTLYFALESALSQTLSVGYCAVVLLDDQSTDDWQTEIADLLEHPGLILLKGHCGSAALARNAILDFVESDLPNVRWVARLDPDDLLCSSTSVDALVCEGEFKGASFVLGSNYVERDRVPVRPDNIANPDILLEREQLVQFIEVFCLGQSANELPSCNLLLRTRRGIRYPSIHSAEDHWLVAQLLFFRADEAAILPYPVYCHYSLCGQTTTNNEKIGAHRRVREELASASRTWLASRSDPGEFLGFGMEGCVWRQGEFVVKLFYPHIAKQTDIAQLAQASMNAKGRIPVFHHLISESGATFCRYRDQPLETIGTNIPLDEVRGFLLDLAQAGLVASNIKRENLRFSTGRLTYIDIGRDIQPYAPSRFLDSAARLYALGVLGWPGGELTRRNSTKPQHVALAELDGFAAFYNGLVLELHPLTTLPKVPAANSLVASDVTLLIKACPQDHAIFREQVAHIVFQLSAPRRFAKVVVAIDPFVGAYLRQYTTGNLQALLDSADELKTSGVIDAVWVAPEDIGVIEATYAKWFAINGITSTHTHSGAPLFAQLWAFGQVSTRFVLQADLDVLIGRKDHDHDFLLEMLEATSHPSVWCVGFNIPKKPKGFRPYASRPKGFVPEIRLGLLDLQKISANLPLPNSVCQGQLEKMWHRSMEEAQRACGMETVRGGDDRSFYVHPSNETKQVSNLEVERDLVAQGLYPAHQAEQWDLSWESHWQYPKRPETLVFLLKGRNTPLDKLMRCLDSLRQQQDQDFGVILIDDASSPDHSWLLNHHLGSLRAKTTLVRRKVRRGYIPNFLLASELCICSDTLIAVLDQDDALMNRNVVSALKRARSDGADLINGLMYRPNKPTQIYYADYVNPRSKGGGNTWTHLRAFTKKLFDQVPTEEFRVAGQWIPDISDWATMLPMAELAIKPVQLTDQYYVWHERAPYPADRKLEQAQLIQCLMSRVSPAVRQTERAAK